MTISNSGRRHQCDQPEHLQLPPSSPIQDKNRRNHQISDQEVEVIALSSETLLAAASTDFACEFCRRVFTRDQYLQRHLRRHHDQPSEPKRVYVCPKPSCIYHAPSRAFGDLTAVMNHFRRMHCEKKSKCDKCFKRYALRSDWENHTKSCGVRCNRRYPWDCGAIFSRFDLDRRVSLIIHRGSCAAEERAMTLTEEERKAL